MKKLLVLAAIAGCMGVTQARAEVIDVATIKCSDLGKMSKDEVAFVLTWLSGYEAGKGDSSTFDTDKMASTGKTISEKCAANADMGLMSIVKEADAE